MVWSLGRKLRVWNVASFKGAPRDWREYAGTLDPTRAGLARTSPKSGRRMGRELRVVRRSDPSRTRKEHPIANRLGVDGVAFIHRRRSPQYSARRGLLALTPKFRWILGGTLNHRYPISPRVLSSIRHVPKQLVA